MSNLIRIVAVSNHLKNNEGITSGHIPMATAKAYCYPIARVHRLSIGDILILQDTGNSYSLFYRMKEKSQ